MGQWGWTFVALTVLVVLMGHWGWLFCGVWVGRLWYSQFCSIYEVFRLVVFGVFRVSVVLMGRWGWTLVAFTAFVVSGLSESFEVDGWVVKVSGQSRDIIFKKAICKEMPSRVAGWYQPRRWRFSLVAGYFWQPWVFVGHWVWTFVVFTVLVLCTECWSWMFVAFTAFVAFRLVIFFVAFRVFVAFMELWVGTLVAFTVLVVFVGHWGWSFCGVYSTCIVYEVFGLDICGNIAIFVSLLYYWCTFLAVL